MKHRQIIKLVGWDTRSERMQVEPQFRCHRFLLEFLSGCRCCWGGVSAAVEVLCAVRRLMAVANLSSAQEPVVGGPGFNPGFQWCGRLCELLAVSGLCYVALVGIAFATTEQSLTVEFINS